MIKVLVTLGLTIYSIWLHELGHAGVAWVERDRLGERRWSLKPMVNLDPLLSILIPLATSLLSGGVLAGGIGRPFVLAKANTKIILAGPMVNLLLGGVGALFHWHQLASLNLILFAFNMLPIKPLDGWALWSMRQKR